MGAGKKRCRTCKRTKPLRLFYKRKANKDGYAGSCKACVNKSGNHSNHDHNLRVRYGITHAEYEAMLSSQGGACAICRGGTSKRYFAVDHNHRTGEVRGLLCGTCNTTLGRFRDDPARFKRAAKYLTAPPARRVLGERDWGDYKDDNKVATGRSNRR